MRMAQVWRPRSWHGRVPYRLLSLLVSGREFDRRPDSNDPPLDFLFEVANHFLAELRLLLMAPDLSEIGTIRPDAELQQKLLDPNAAIRPGNRYIDLTMKNGAKMSGHLLNQDTFTIQLLDVNERLVSVSRSDVRDLVFVKDSPIPSYRDTLSRDELADVVAYLVTLKGYRP